MSNAAKLYPGLSVDNAGRPYLNGILANDELVLARFPSLKASDLWDLYSQEDLPIHRVTMPPINQPPPADPALDLVPHTPVKQSIGTQTYGDQRGTLLAAHDRLNRMEETIGVDGGSMQINHASPEDRMDSLERVLEDRSLRVQKLIAKIGNKLIQNETGTELVPHDSKAFYGQMLELAQQSITEQGNWQEGYEKGYADALAELPLPSRMTVAERAREAWNLLRGKDGNAEKVEA